MARSWNNHHSDTDRRFSNSVYDHRIAEQQRADLYEQMAEHHGARPSPVARKRRLGLASATKQPVRVEPDHLFRIAALQDEMMLVRGGIWESINRLKDMVFDFTEVSHRSYDLYCEINDLVRKADNIIRGQRQAPRDRPWFLTGIAA